MGLSFFVCFAFLNKYGIRKNLLTTIKFSVYEPTALVYALVAEPVLWTDCSAVYFICGLLFVEILITCFFLCLKIIILYVVCYFF